MNISNAAAQTSETKSQKGFSLIELLVVVAIIGVLAAAGIVGYQSYLDGVKKDTQVNNAIALAKGLEVAGVAASSGLTSALPACTTYLNEAKASPVTADHAKAIACLRASIGSTAEQGKFKSPYKATLTAENAAPATSYLIEGANCSGGAIRVEHSDPATITITPCDNAATSAAITDAGGNSAARTVVFK